MKSGTLVIIKPDGTQTESRLTGRDVPTLDALQAAVGGYIERVRVRFQGRVRDAYVNEEGAINGLPRNKRATELLANPGILTLNGYLQGNMAVWVPDPKEG